MRSTTVITSTDAKNPTTTVDLCDSVNMYDCNETNTVNNVNIKSAHNVVDVVNHADDPTCIVINPLNPKEPKLLEDELWDDYVTLAEFKMHDEEMTRIFALPIFTSF